MGCRPSRRAAVCVRVAGDGPWGVRRSSRSVGAAGGVQLRERSTRVGHGGRACAHPQDRYSAPPTDTHFPPHSCTTATYHHGCCGRSRITLRLSKNGSTLEIETTEFQDGDRACQVCSVDDFDAAGVSDDSVPLRTQSAPNLTTVTRDERWFCPSSPVPRRRRLVLGRVGSGTGSVRTAAAVEVNVEERNGERKPSISSAACAAAAAAASKVDTPGFLSDKSENSNSECLVSEEQTVSNGVGSDTRDTPDNSVIKTNSLETADVTSSDKDDVDSSSRADSLTHIDGVKMKVKVDSPRVVLKAGCHKSSDSLKKLWCHTNSDLSRVAATAVSAKWERQSDESTDTGCESDEEDKLRLLSRLEMGPTYVHTDFKNDFEDLFDDTSPGLEDEKCCLHHS